MGTLKLILSILKAAPILLVGLANWLIAGVQTLVLPIAQLSGSEKLNAWGEKAIKQLEVLRGYVELAQTYLIKLGM